jgi:uncharacterized protein (TIGR00369 family)
MLNYVTPVIFALRPRIMYDLLRRRLGEIVPLNTLLGIEIVSIGDGIAEARIPFRTEVTNHIGTLHATAIFGLAEAASGAAMSGAFAPVILRIRPVAASAKVTFLKITRSDLTAHAVTGEPSPDLRDKLDHDGKVTFDVAVTMRDAAGHDIAEMTVAWHVSKKA